MGYEILHGDCFDVMSLCIEDNSIDAIVCDPPYGLGFMGKHWDHGVPAADVWVECLRVLKPGGYLLAFAGTRTQHRMAVNIEDAGFEIRDMIAWVYGSGFPKSLDVSKAIDKSLGAQREQVRSPMGPTGNKYAKGLGDPRPWMAQAAEAGYHEHDSDEPATDAARQWQGWGTALKPALEPITVARKPLGKGTVAENVLAFGTGGLNIDGCRVGDEVLSAVTAGQAKLGTFERGLMTTPERTGRWPANLIHDGSDEVVALFPEQSSGSRAAGVRKGMGFHGADGDGGPAIEGTSGSAARFFYCAKASKRDRDDGVAGVGALRDGGRESLPRKNHHPTVKPTDLMRYLCRLVTPPGGLILDPFLGSGSTGKAAMLEGFDFIGIEKEAEYVEIARARIAGVKA